MPQPTKEVQHRRKHLISQGIRDCTKCNKDKPLSEFPKQTGRPGNVASECKKCRSKVQGNHYRRNREKILAYCKIYFQNNKSRYRDRIREYRKDPKFRERERIYSKAYNASEHGQQIRQKYAKSDSRKQSIRAWQERNPEKKLATWHVWKAKRDGRLVQPPNCEVCGIKTKTLHAHHHKGYKPEYRLDVQWVCVGCHEAIHHNIPIKVD